MTKQPGIPIVLPETLAAFESLLDAALDRVPEDIRPYVLSTLGLCLEARKPQPRQTPKPSLRVVKPEDGE